jgi:hypothetical protein
LGKALQENLFHLELYRDRLILLDLPVLEGEIPLRPQEKAVDRFLGLALQGLGHHLLRDPSLLDQDLPQHHPGLFLDIEGFLELGLGDELLADHDLTEELAGIVGAAGDDDAAAQKQLFDQHVVLQHQRSGLAGLADPLQKVRERHGLKMSGKSGLGGQGASGRWGRSGDGPGI